MNRITLLCRLCAVSVFVLLGCQGDFPCTTNADCQVFGADTVCEIRNPAFGMRCYLPFPERQCQLINTSDILTSSAPTESATFGIALSATNGNTVLIGAPGDKDMSGDSLGNAEVFSVSQSGSWTSATLFNNRSVDVTGIGTGVAIRNGRAIVTAQNHAYAFEENGTWTTPRLISSPAAGSPTFKFEAGAALTDTFAFVGYNEGFSPTAYSAEKYDFADGTFHCNVAQQNDLDGFATTLAANDTWLAVGASGGDPPSVNGEVCLFNYASQDCPTTPTCNLLPRANPAKDRFGNAVAMSGNLLVVGAPDQLQQPFFAYTVQDSAWAPTSQPATFLMTDAEDWGVAIAIDSDLLVVGAPGVADNSGAAKVYQWRNNNWNLLTELSPPAAGNIDFTKSQFGRAVAVSGDLVFVGAPYATVSSVSSAGAVLVYHCPAQP